MVFLYSWRIFSLIHHFLCLKQICALIQMFIGIWKNELGQKHPALIVQRNESNKETVGEELDDTSSTGKERVHPSGSLVSEERDVMESQLWLHLLVWSQKTTFLFWAFVVLLESWGLDYIITKLSLSTDILFLSQCMPQAGPWRETWRYRTMIK